MGSPCPLLLTPPFYFFTFNLTPGRLYLLHANCHKTWPREGSRIARKRARAKLSLVEPTANLRFDGARRLLRSLGLLRLKKPIGLLEFLNVFSSPAPLPLPADSTFPLLIAGPLGFLNRRSLYSPLFRPGAAFAFSSCLHIQVCILHRQLAQVSSNRSQRRGKYPRPTLDRAKKADLKAAF